MVQSWKLGVIEGWRIGLEGVGKVGGGGEEGVGKGEVVVAVEWVSEREGARR